MSRYCYSKLKNTWLSEDRKQTYSYTDPPPTSSKGLVVFDIDDTLRVVNGSWSNCQWRTAECNFPNNTLADTQSRAVHAINTFYKMGYAIAIYTKETTNQLDVPHGAGALAYVTGLASKITNPDYKAQFTQDILVNYETNIMFGTGSKYGNDKGKGLIKLANRLNIPHNKVLMFDDTNSNINDITKSGICGITVSNTPNICGISDQNLSDGVNFMNSGQCRSILQNPSITKPSKNDKTKPDPSLGVFCAPH
jgi:hypothetical protein